MSEYSIFGEDWRALRKLRAECNLFGLLLLGALMLYVWTGPRFEIVLIPISMILFWLWISSVRRIYEWPCPRCGRPFYKGDLVSPPPHFPKKRCGHCDLAV